MINLWQNQEKRRLVNSLDLVLLRIDLPPVSDDQVGTSRDNREVIDENIAKAQTIYGILSSISAQKKLFNLNRKINDYFGFEIVAGKHSIVFYALAPARLIEVLKNAIIGGYPNAKLAEVEEDHNLFDKDIRTEDVVCGQLKLKNPYYQPINSYIDSKKDALKSILNALTSLKDKEGACIQILFRPAPKGWINEALSQVKKKKGGSTDGLLNQFASVVFKGTEGSDKGKSEPELSQSDRDLIEAIETKIQQPGFEVLIRLMVSTTNRIRSSTIYDSMVSGFSLFEKPNSNGFTSTISKRPAEMVEDFNLRYFPSKKSDVILNSIEMASLFHLPDQVSLIGSQVARQVSKEVDGPRNMSTSGLVLGDNVFRGRARSIILGDEDRMRHVYVVGQTGVGKSVFLQNLIIQDIERGGGFAIVDPHGDLAEQTLAKIPAHRRDDVFYFNPAEMEYPLGLNLFEHTDDDYQDILIQEGINMLYKLYDTEQQGVVGPRFEYMFRNAAKLIMSGPEGGTFIDIPKLFNDPTYIKQKLKYCTDKTVIDYWTKEYPATEQSRDVGDLKAWFVSKFSAFLGNAAMRNILGQPASSFNIRQIMDEKKILIVNLNKGLTGELNTKLLGMLLVIKFQMAAMSRVAINPKERVDFTLYVDEFQNFATESFASILSEARKYRLSLVVANQHTTQLTEEIRESVFGNVGTVVIFRVGSADAEIVTQQFLAPSFSAEDLVRLPIGQVACRMLIGGTPSQPFSLRTAKPPLEIDPATCLEYKKFLLERHGRPRELVEEQIEQRLFNRKSKPAFGMSDSVAKLLK